MSEPVNIRPKMKLKGQRKGPFILNIIDEEVHIGRNDFDRLVTSVES